MQYGEKELELTPVSLLLKSIKSLEVDSPTEDLKDNITEEHDDKGSWFAASGIQHFHPPPQVPQVKFTG